MRPNEVLGFLLPQWGDPLQVGFLFIILALMVFTIVSAHRNACSASWEHKWNRGTPNDDSDDLDIEHGSVTDLWNAVATWPEKLAEIMPGMLLVIGLLGTFLGLGLALNHASNILGHPEALSASGAANSMQDLLGLLQGLGTKFKTSTWGITGFVLLKIWSEISRFDEKRLSWVISKVKTELDKRKQAQTATEAAKQEALFVQIRGAADTIVQGSENCAALHIKQNKDLHQEALSKFEVLSQGLREDLGQIIGETQASSVAMAQFTEGTRSVIENMAEAAQRMAGGADKVGEAAGDLVGAIDAFKSQFTDVLDDVRAGLSAAINDMSGQAAKTLEAGSTKLETATSKISETLGTLSGDVKTTMMGVKESIKEAQVVQGDAISTFNATANSVGEYIEVATQEIGKLAGPITEGLESVSESSERIKRVAISIDRMTEKFEALGVCLDSLSGDFKCLSSIQNGQAVLIKRFELLSVIIEGKDDLLSELRSLHDSVKDVKAFAAPVSSLSDVVDPILSISSNQQRMLSSLDHLREVPGHQQAVLRELQGLREELGSRSEITDSALAS